MCVCCQATEAARSHRRVHRPIHADSTLFLWRTCFCSLNSRGWTSSFFYHPDVIVVVSAKIDVRRGSGNWNILGFRLLIEVAA